MTGLARFSLRRPGLVLTALALAALALGAGIPRLETRTGYRAFLGGSHPVIRTLDAFAQRFGGGLPFAIVYECADACPDALDPVALRMADAVAARLAAAPGVTRVDGPATSPLLVRPVIGLPEARRLVEGGRVAPDLARLAARAVEDPTWVGQIVSADRRAGALVVQLEDSKSATGRVAVETALAALAPYEAQGFRFQLIGGPVEFVVAGAELERGTRALVPVMVGLVAIVLAGLFRRIGPALLAMASVGLAVLFALGLQGWLGFPLNSFSNILPPLLLVIGVCDAVHLLAAFVAAAPGAGAEPAPSDPVAARAARERAVVLAVERVARPCVLTTLTTAAGFVSFCASGLESFVQFGLVAAAGVCAALLTCFTLLPIALVRVPVGWCVASPRGWERALAWFASLAARRAPAVVAVAGVGLVLAALGIPRLEIDARFEDLYGEQSQVVRWVRAASVLLREAETLEVELDLPPGVRTDDPAALRELAGIERLAERPDLGPALSVLTPVREVHYLLHRVPLGDDAEAAARALRLVRSEEPAFVRRFASEPDDETGRAALRVSFQAAKLAQPALRALHRDVAARLAGLPAGYDATLTGPLATVNALVDEIRATQLSSFGLAFALVMALIVAGFRSVRLGALALIPTLLPVALTLGSMGWLGIRLDVGSAMVAAVVLGLSVDDAIHLLQAFDCQRRAGSAVGPAALGAVAEVGQALVTTSIALVAGFAALTLAPWGSIRSFGSVSAIAIFGALLADLLVLPALLILTGRIPGALESARSGR